MTTQIWVRAEQRANETRVAVTPDGAAALLAQGYRVTVEDSPHRCIKTEDYLRAGCEIAATGSWTKAPKTALILGLKELPEAETPLVHTHIMFGHAFKGQPAGQVLVARLRAGGGALLDLEYLTNSAGRRLAAFGYFAGFAGAGVALLAYAAQKAGRPCPAVTTTTQDDLVAAVAAALVDRPRVIVIGALGRVGTGARDLCHAVGLTTTDWDIAETARGAPFPEVLAHEVFLNAILAMPGCPVLVPKTALTAPRALSVIGDIACDPTSDFNPIPVYDRVTTWEQPTLRVAEVPPLDVVAIDNLPSLLPTESSQDFATQLLPLLLQLDSDPDQVWARARARFDAHQTEVDP